MAHPLNPYRSSSRRHLVAEHYFQGDSESWTYQHLAPLVNVGALVFSRNLNGRRVPSSPGEQLVQLERTIKTTFHILRQEARNQHERTRAFNERRSPAQEERQRQLREEEERQLRAAKGEQRPQYAPDEAKQEEAERREEAMRAEAEQEEAEQKAVRAAVKAERSPDFLLKVWRARDIVRRVNEQSAAGGAVPDVGTRAIVNAAQAYKQGVPFEASLHALAMDWTPEIRREAGVTEFDPTTLTLPETTAMPAALNGSVVDVGTHRVMPALVRLAHSRVPIALIGPAGSGKTHVAGQLAKLLELEFSMLPMSGGITRGDICGTETMSGFKSRPFPYIYENGGVFLADEFDAANPRVLPILNAALANSHWKNPMTDAPPIKRHDNFVFVAAMNTTGRGADRMFTARERLDQATLDRFAIGRVVMDYDRELERRIFDSIIEA